ncbi:MAG: hypothetical protein MUQ32_04790 [Chloroflexi bacterium]|nr:hypothetical protein [Chloroflexota bacterium]
MDQPYVIAFAVAVMVALTSLGFMLVRPRRPSTPEGSDSPFGVSTEGMKICPKCGMGNLWTDRACISCRAPLKG